MSQHRLAAGAAVVALIAAIAALIVVARRAPVVDEPPPAPSPPRLATTDPLLATITRLTATTYRVPATTVDAWLAEPTRIARGVTGAHRVHDPDGVQIDDVRPGSLAAALGLETGDVIRGVNGDEVNDLAAIAPKIARSVERVTLDLRRGDHTVILNYLIGR